MDDLLQEFLTEVGADAAAFDRMGLERSPNDPVRLKALFTLLHTVRGTSRFLDLPRLEALASAAEQYVGAVRAQATPVTAATIAPALQALDRILAILAALEDTGREPPEIDQPLMARLAAETPVAAGAMASDPSPPVLPAIDVPAAEMIPAAAPVADTRTLAAQLAALVMARNSLAHLLAHPYRPEVAAAMERLSNATGALRREVVQLRQVAFESCWPALVRTAQRVAEAEGRHVEFQLHGGTVTLERDLLDALQEPIGRVMVHAAGKAVEGADSRKAAGKPSRATVRIAVEQDGRILTVTIADDGAGRGLGREVDTSALLALGGMRKVSAVRGQGTIVQLRVPLRATVEPALVLTCAGSPFFLSQAQVLVLVTLSGSAETRVEPAGDGLVLHLHGRALPLLSLARLLSGDVSVDVPPVVAVIDSGTGIFALAIDAVTDAQDLVVMPLPPLLRDISFLSGAAVLGDGRTALGLEVSGLAATLNGGAGEALPSAKTGAAVGDSVDLLRFLSDAVPMAIPVETLVRLDEVERSALEYEGGKPVMRSPAGPIPLLSVAGPPRIDDGPHPVLILSAADRPVGLVVDSVLDVLRTPLALETAARRPGILGSAMVAGRRTEIVDAAYLAGQV